MLAGLAAVVVAITAILLLFALGIPIFAAFLIVDVVGILMVAGARGFPMLANSIYDTATTGSLTAIPLFLLLGELLFRGRAVTVLFQSVDTLVGRVRGRQYIMSVVLATIFGALSGAAMGVAAMLGRTILPGLAARGGNEKLAMGAILGGASLAPIIPPSLLAIIVGTLAGVSIAELLVAGIVPGLILATMFIAYIFVRVTLDPSLEPRQDAAQPKSAGLFEMLRALANLMPFVIIIVSVIGFIMLGIATPSEAAATGVVAALITTALYERITPKMIWDSCKSAAMISAMILVIMVSSKMFSQLLAMTGGISALTVFLTGLDIAPWLMFIILLALPFVLCMFLDQIALMLIIVPIYRPILDHFGFDPVWFWLIFLINITLGGITPPFGYTLFALKGAAGDVPIRRIFAASWPFVGLIIAGVALFAVFPPLVTALPDLLSTR